MLTYLFVLQLLRFVLDRSLLAAYFKLATELVSIHDLIVEEQLARSTMLDPTLGIGLHWFSHQS